MNAEDVILEVSHLEKSFGSHDVLRDISFQVAKGDVVSVHRSVRFRKIHNAPLCESVRDTNRWQHFISWRRYHRSQRSMYRHTVLRLEWYSRVLICLTT